MKKEYPPLDHKRLCQIGVYFLKKKNMGHSCQFAIIEPACNGENPDVFGVRHGYTHDIKVGTILLEAKTSRADFLGDKRKPHRVNPETGVGKWRYYICPEGLIKPEELPPKWGLIYALPSGKCKVIAGAFALPILKHTYNDRVTYYQDYEALKQSLIDYEFGPLERNVTNEVNIIAMLLNRLGDTEETAYKIREYNNLKQKYITLKHEHGQLKRDFNLNSSINYLNDLASATPRQLKNND